MGLFFVFVVVPKVFRTPKKTSRTPQLLKKTKENKNHLRENQTNKVFKGFRPTLGYGFCCFLFFGFPEGFWKTTNILEKTTNTKETQRKPKQPLCRTKKQSFERFQTHPWIWVLLFFLVFPKVICCIVKTSCKTKNKTKRKHIQGWI